MAEIYQKKELLSLMAQPENKCEPDLIIEQLCPVCSTS